MLSSVLDASEQQNTHLQSRWQRQNRDLYSVIPEYIFIRNKGWGGVETDICDKEILSTANSEKNTGAGCSLFQTQLFVRKMFSLILKRK